MAWVRFSEVQERFTHLDAKLTSVSVQFERNAREASLVVRFYPWWEHPLFKKAVQDGENWGFQDTDDAQRDVMVRAVNPVGVKLSGAPSVTDWELLSEHPALWEFQEETKIFINAPMVMTDLIDRLLERRIPYVGRRELYSYLDPGAEPTSSRAVMVPSSLTAPVLEALTHLGVPSFVPHSPRVEGGLQVLLLDGCDYIVAEDFLIDVPAFVHKPEWFHPVGGGDA